LLSGLPAVLVAAIRRGLPESDVWRRRLPAHDHPIRGVPYLGRAFGLAVLNMSSYWLTYTWLPTYLREERGLSIAGSGTKPLVGGVFNAARGVQLVAPMLVALLARRYGLAGGIALAAGFALAAAGWVWLLPETRGRHLEP